MDYVLKPAVLGAHSDIIQVDAYTWTSVVKEIWKSGL